MKHGFEQVFKDCNLDDESLDFCSFYSMDECSIKIRSNIQQAISYINESFEYYKTDTPIQENYFTVNIYHLGGRSLNPFKSLLLNEKVVDGILEFNWEYGKGFSWDDESLVFVDFEKENKVTILVNNSNETSSESIVGRGPLRMRKIGFQYDWDLVADLIKGIYANAINSIIMHAACVEKNGKGILITGDSGAGKTTTSTLLINSGYNFLCDDISFVKGGDELSVSGMLMSPRYVGSAPNSIRDIEETISPSSQNYFASQIVKQKFELPKNVVLNSKKTRTIPELVLLIKMPDKREKGHVANIVPETEAFIKLMRQVIDPFSITRRRYHIDVIHSLINGSRIYEFIPGYDLKSINNFIENL